MEKRFVWRGYEHKQSLCARSKPAVYSVELTKKQFNKLWERFKNFKGSQQDFYFKYVNKYKLREMPADPKKKIPIKTELKGGN